MNEQLNSALAEVLKASKDGIVNIALFAQQQAPELIKQVFTFSIIERAIDLVFFIFAIFALKFLLDKAIKLNADDDGHPSAFVMFLVFGIGTLLVFFGLNDCLINIAKIVFAPKLFLIEYCKNLIK